MSWTMIVIAILVVWTVGIAAFVLGALYKANRVEAQVLDAQESAEVVIDILQSRLANDKDYRGFSTRTQVFNWLEGMRDEVVEAFE